MVLVVVIGIGFTSMKPPGSNWNGLLHIACSFSIQWGVEDIGGAS